MIVIFGSRFDESSYSLATRWADQNACVLTSSDLSVAGWRHYLNSENKGAAVVNGHVLPTREIKGVLIRWPGVFEQELTHIVSHDRDYVAREMMAFLVSWFSSLKCPVINQPTPVNLCGPAWRPEQWTYAASRIGMTVQKAERHVSREEEDHEDNLSLSPTNITVIGNRCFGDAEQSLNDQALRLAKLAGVSLINVTFSGPLADSHFLAADLLPKLNDEMADAVLENLLKSEANSV